MTEREKVLLAINTLRQTFYLLLSVQIPVSFYDIYKGHISSAQEDIRKAFEKLEGTLK